MKQQLSEPTISALWPWLVSLWFAGFTAGLIASHLLPDRPQTGTALLLTGLASFAWLGGSLWILRHQLRLITVARDSHIGTAGQAFGTAMAHREREIGHP